MPKLNIRFQNFKINAKFNSLLMIAFLAGIILSGITLSNVLYQRAQYEISIQAELLMQTMNSLRFYTQDQVNPLLRPKLATSPNFIPQAIPTFSVREVSRYLSKNEAYKEFHYKDATLNPTNPLDQADDFETKLVNQFQSQPEKLELSGFRSDETGKRFYTARPFVIKQTKCLDCHSRPEIAPKSLIAKYGERGFGWKLNDIVAAQIVYVPYEEVFDKARQAFFKSISVVIAIFLAVTLLINFLLKKVVIVRIRKIANTANAISTGDMSSHFQEDSKDEIGLLAIAFERMRASLLIAMDLLNQNQSKS
ncbi:sensor protein [Calothrix sp. NIES-4101]|nr:sensor protein [Calothrix sp. NIES-4101]